MILSSSAQRVDKIPVPSLEATIKDLFAPHVSVALTDPSQTYPQPFLQEAEAVKRACPKRQGEFFAGRAAVREAMQQLGYPGQPVLAGRDRAPVWPHGLIGSISHCDALCVAALSEISELRSIGIDVESDTPLEPDLIPTVCSLIERAWLSSQPEADRGLLAKLIFSAKECAYKCQFPVTRTMFDFDTLEITPDLDTGQFEATFTRDVDCIAQGTCFHGRFVILDGLIITGTMLSRRPRWSMRGQ